MTKVLIVEDERACRESTSILLSLKGFEVEAAAEGREAIELAKAFLPDVLIADRVLGGDLDGIQVSEALRSAHPKIRIIVITGYSTAELEARMERFGCMQCLTKPVPPEELIAAVRKAADGPD